MGIPKAEGDRKEPFLPVKEKEMVESPFEFKKGSEELSFELWNVEDQSLRVLGIIRDQEIRLTHPCIR